MTAEVRASLRFGWWGLAVFACLGLGLEALHGLKVGFFLDVGNETRRLMWTLAHAHGTLLSLLHIAWGATLFMLGPAPSPRPRRQRATRLLRLSTVLMPGGFALGGAWIHGGDPGIATALLVPPGAVALLIALGLAAAEVSADAAPVIPNEVD